MAGAAHERAVLSSASPIQTFMKGACSPMPTEIYPKTRYVIAAETLKEAARNGGFDRDLGMVPNVVRQGCPADGEHLQSSACRRKPHVRPPAAVVGIQARHPIQNCF
jgi:hypothetical protein